MTKKLTRRSVIAGTIATVTASLSAKAKPAPETSMERSFAAMQRMMDEGKGLQVFEVTGTAHGPHYRKGDLVIAQMDAGQPADHIVINRKSEPILLGALVHRDAKALYMRGLKAGDKMQAVPLKSVAQWGRVAIHWRA